MRKLAAAVLFALAAAACGGAATETPLPTETPPVGPAVTQPSASSPDTAPVEPSTTTATTATTEAADPDGPFAPDFTLALSDGSIFTLSSEQKPVYLIFWAEW